MKFDWKIILVLVLLAALVFRECSRPEKIDYADQAFKDTIEVLKQEKAVIQSRQEATIKRYVDRIKLDSIQRSAFKIENTRLKKQLATRRPQVQVLIDSTPPLRAFIQTQDSIILTQDVRIDSLESSLRFQYKLHEDLIVAEFQEDRAEQQMFIEQERRIEELQKLSRKEKKKSRLKGILVPVALIGGLLFGASL